MGMTYVSASVRNDQAHTHLTFWLRYTALTERTGELLRQLIPFALPITRRIWSNYFVIIVYIMVDSDYKRSSGTYIDGGFELHFVFFRFVD